MNLPTPVIEVHNGFRIVRDDLIPGGTKRRVVSLLLDDRHEEYVYASPRQGYAQIAIALACRDAGKRATIFLAEAAEPHPLTVRAVEAGATIIDVKMGFLKNVQSAARQYAQQKRARLLPFGLDAPVIRDGLAAVARSLPFVPAEVWTVAGSGMLTRSLQQAWPEPTRFHVVKVGKDDIDTGRATIHRCTRSFAQNAKVFPPFPSAKNYDCKAWEFMLKYASPMALFWNVGA